MNKVTLGDVIREMVRQAIKSDKKLCVVPVRKIFNMVNGYDYPDEIIDEETGEFKTPGREIAGLKSSYIYNTAARMQELRDIDMHVKHRFIWLASGEETVARKVDGDGADKNLLIQLEPGALKPTKRKTADIEKEAATIERFKSRLLKIAPNIIDLQGEQKEGALIALARYYEMIKEAN
ncbi:hypothetical protein HOR61_gp20 [Escherichia phage vB_EcoS-IME253]|uniref:Uncharacterized protein n=1 Tax=Escherichia phage vB_EcoS-IME253 TaxID=1933412 RepID=A0A1P8DUN1_9CAUD|nr:hypothetical protein HOR61_gp20 [Escherichia phage vB_EcoS-IME253]APU93220.1 hypothetical protein [Escherichia phage vB_EcoS-IME253]